jgi:hypothetical protein
MLSDQIHRALAKGHSRFQVCRMTAKGVKVMHKPGSRFEETISTALEGMSGDSQESKSAPQRRGDD